MMKIQKFFDRPDHYGVSSLGAACIYENEFGNCKKYRERGTEGQLVEVYPGEVYERKGQGTMTIKDIISLLYEVERS